jgi:long-subunit fatty acid transport protein
MSRDDRRSLRSGRALRRAVRPAIALAAALTVLFAPAGAGAQQFLASNRFNFDFSNPGARSLGFGGAFAGLADDATAAFANPAGLVQLTRPEVSLEGRWWDRSPSFVAGGRVDGEPTGRGIDTVSGLRFGRDESSAAGPSFAAVVLPRGSWSFAVYGHRLSAFEIVTEFQGFFGEDQPPFLPDRSPAFRERVDLDILAAGFAAARSVNDRLSVGLALVHSEVSLTTDTGIYIFDLQDPDGVFEEIPLIPERRVSTRALAIDDADWSLQAGVLWRPVERVSAGFFYREGAEAEGPLRIDLGFAGEPGFEITGTGAFAVPDVWGAGLAYRSPGGRWTVAGELDRVGYEGLLREVIDGEEVQAAEHRDGWEARFGVEFALLRRQPIVAFRAGGWEAEGDGLVEERITHLAVGLGIAAERFQIDLAADFSEEIDTGSLSFIYAF